MISQKQLRIILSIALVLYITGMFIIATARHVPEVESVQNFDKYVHATEFCIFSILLLLTLAVHGFDDYFLIAFALVLIIIVISEIVQIPIVNRTFSVLDMMADLIGVSIGFASVYFVNTKWNLLKQFY